jgi:hypothetical protein
MAVGLLGITSRRNIPAKSNTIPDDKPTAICEPSGITLNDVRLAIIDEAVAADAASTGNNCSGRVISEVANTYVDKNEC